MNKSKLPSEFNRRKFCASCGHFKSDHQPTGGHHLQIKWCTVPDCKCEEYVDRNQIYPARWCDTVLARDEARDSARVERPTGYWETMLVGGWNPPGVFDKKLRRN